MPPPQPICSPAVPAFNHPSKFIIWKIRQFDGLLTLYRWVHGGDGSSTAREPTVVLVTNEQDGDRTCTQSSKPLNRFSAKSLASSCFTALTKSELCGVDSVFAFGGRPGCQGLNEIPLQLGVL